MDYEQLLSTAFEKIKPCEKCERFEIRKVAGHIEGSKTIISNFLQVAGCLRREPEHLAKFLFKELATSGEMDGDRLILTRKVTSQNVNEKVEKYANYFVLCSKCGKPDTELVDENGQMVMRCLACGSKKPISGKI